MSLFEGDLVGGITFLLILITAFSVGITLAGFLIGKSHLLFITVR